MARSVAAYFLGGTISMSGGAGDVVANVSAEELVAGVTQFAAHDIALEAHQLQLLPSGSLTFDNIVELVGIASKAHVDGVVVVQGTDTIEETAFLLDLLWPHDVPVVVTGAMRNASQAGADGAANLLAATIVAASPAFEGLGALVVLNDEVHAARYVRKTHTTSTGAFASPTAGPLGYVLEERAVRVGSVGRKRVFQISCPVSVRIGLVAIGLDDGGEVFEGLGERCDGAVLLSFGGGHVPYGLVEPLADLAKQVPLIVASRTSSGPTLANTYGYPGSETDLLRRGLIGAGFLDAFKARVLLQVLLSNGFERAKIRASFASYGEWT